MGNDISLIDEVEEIHKKLPDFRIDKKLCLWQSQDNLGKLYDVSGSHRSLISNYACVHLDEDPIIAKFNCNKISIGKNDIALQSKIFTNVRESTICRKYNRSGKLFSDTKDHRIIGEYNGKIYDITHIY
jgi:hypothetical protein